MAAGNVVNRGKKGGVAEDTSSVDESLDNSGSDDNAPPKRIKTKVTAGGAWTNFLQTAGAARTNQTKSDIESAKVRN